MNVGTRAAFVVTVLASGMVSSAAAEAERTQAPPTAIEQGREPTGVEQSSTPRTAEPLGVGKTPEGRPDIHLDRLDFPKDLRESSALRKHLLRVLAQEVRRVEWGAGRENRIEYRYAVTQLSLKQEGGVLEVTCTSVGKLPGGKTAKSHLSFGGAPKERYALLKKVLEIVARGVIARLAELERKRRGLSE